MAQQSKPAQQLEFRGVLTNGNPLARPFHTAAYCHNLRVMPGFWLRTWGGRKARSYGASGTWKQFHEYRDPSYSGWTNHIAQHADSGNVNKWKWVSLNNFLITDILTIDGSFDSNYATNNALAVANLRDRVVLYNGLGVRDSNGSRSPLTSYFPTEQKNAYFGLDAHVPGGTNPAAAASGAGSITIATHRKIYVGLWNTRTGHFGNGVLAGTISAATGIGIQITNLNLLKVNYYDAYDQGLIKYVFYSTLDGGEVPYLLLDANNIDPVSELSTNTTKTITALNLDQTKEMPTTNHPPRPMRWLAVVNGRMYGCLMLGGSDSAAQAGFRYPPDQRYYAGIVYSAAADDVTDREFLGAPEESWPLTNFSGTPNAEIPICGVPAPDGYRLLAITPTSTFLVEEAADHKHEWTTVSDIHGIARIECMAKTPRGPVWLTQRNQIAMLRGESLEVLSVNYQTLLKGKTPRFATYTLDPINQIDRYEAYFTDGTGVFHDFLANDGGTMDGDYTAARSLTRQDALVYHITAKAHLYTQAGQPENGVEKVRNEDYTGPATTAFTAIDGEWRSQWGDFGEPGVRKDFPWLDIIGDGENLTVEWYANLKETSVGNKFTATKEALAQQDAPSMWRFKLTQRLKYYYKLVLKMAGSTTVDEHPTLDEYGVTAAGDDMTGSVVQARYTVENTENRP